MRSLLTIFFILVLLNPLTLGCRSESVTGFPPGYFDYELEVDDSLYKKWLDILGSDNLVDDYILEVQNCINYCQQDGSFDWIVLNPPSDPACSCIF